MKFSIGVIGTGALGSFYGAKLKQAGCSLTLIARSDFDYLSQTPLNIKSIWGDFQCTPDYVVKEGKSAPVVLDYLIVSTKVLPLIDFKSLITPYLSPQTILVLLQNGIHIEAPIQTAFPHHTILSVLAFSCISRTSPGHIHHQDYGRLVIGDFPSGCSTATEQLCACFKASGVPAKASEQIGKDRWQKLIWNAPFNPLSVLTGGATTHKLLSTKDAESFIYSTMKEVQALAQVDGYSIPDSVIEKNIQDTKSMTPYKTSMLLDVEAGRAIETEAILGNAVRFGEENKISIPHLKMLYTLLTLYVT